MVALGVLSWWMFMGVAFREAGLIRYHQWRFLKPNATERDQWRGKEVLPEQVQKAPAPTDNGIGRLRGPQQRPPPQPQLKLLVSPLVKELRFPSVGDRQAQSILALVVNCHAPSLGVYVVPDLIESLRTAPQGVRLQIRNALLAIQRADYPKTKLPDTLAKWEPQKDESPGDLDERVRAGLVWWREAEPTKMP